jgi:hypothetical protein
VGDIMENLKNNKSIQSCITIIITGILLVFICNISIIQLRKESYIYFSTMSKVQNEFLPSTLAGQYYEAIFYRNLDEINEIYNNDLFHASVITFPRLLRFYPGIKALVNGEGDTVKITSEQVNALQAELNWLLERCKPNLCRDIRSIEDRLSLISFIDMTYQEAWDYINLEYIKYNEN